MRFATIGAALAVAAVCFAAPSAFAQSDNKLGSPTVNIPADPSVSSDNLTDPVQDAGDDSVYGVRASSADSLLGGKGSYEVLGRSTQSASLTPDPCNSSGNFPGGWCQTAHSVAANAFGWNFSAGGQGVIIGIVDTGIDLNNPEFTGRILRGTCIVSSANPCTAPDDRKGGDDAVFPGPNSTHGTHVAGIAAGTNTGIAFEASILPVKVCSSTADSCDGVDDGILWASQHGANIISVSIGGPILTSSDIDEFREAVANGALLVVAGGNSGNKDPSTGFLSGAALADGVRGSMIVVGATGCNGPNPNVPANCANGGLGGIATFSQTPGNQCDVEDGQRVCLKDYFVVAPGVDIWSSVGNGRSAKPDYGYLSGTSMATPFVSGVAAVIKGAWPQLTASQVANVIFSTADDMGAQGVDPVYGRGAVDITKALSPVGPTVVVTKSFTSEVAKSGNMAAVVAAVGGGQASASTMAQFGVSGAMSSMVSGPLSVAIQNSTILKSAIMIDSFGRNFSADLTKSTFVAPLADLNDFMQAGFYQTAAGFGMAARTPLGIMSVSGVDIATTTPQMLSSGYIPSDRTRFDLQNFNASLTVAPGVAMEMGYNTQLAGRFNAYDTMGSKAYDGLFFSASAVNSPYVGLTDGGNYIGSTVKISDTLHFQFGASSMTPQTPEFEVPLFPMLNQLEGPQQQFTQRRSEGSMAGLTWDYARWGGLGLTVSQTDEHNGMLGGFTSGALSVSRLAQTSAIGLSDRVGFGSGWVATASYSEGMTHLDLNQVSVVDSADTLHSRAYGVALAKLGVFDESDSVGLAVTRPIQVYDGGVDLTAATNIDSEGDLTFSHEHVSLASATPETDLEAGYTSQYLDGAMSLQTNVAFQMNVNGRNNENAVTLLSRLNYKF